ncbi:MAG: hypothetical protein F4Y04_03865 [Chloroflexi bacterium]|nr:hypothetical protein [Chloroflexota bacterium]
MADYAPDQLPAHVLAQYAESDTAPDDELDHLHDLDDVAQLAAQYLDDLDDLDLAPVDAF